MVIVYGDAHPFQACAVCIGTGLTVIMGDDDAAHEEAAFHELVPEAEDIHVISDAEVAADLVLLYVDGTYDYDDFTVFA